jgi:HEPN domain-containing protein
MDNNKVAEEWFRFGENDFESAKFLTQMVPIPYEIICYHCQQCAEKYLKGYIAMSGGHIVKTHDLTLLNKICARSDTTFTEILDDCIELVDYGVQVRYPFQIELEYKDMRTAIDSANRIRLFVISKRKGNNKS